MRFFTQKSKFSKFHTYFFPENESNIKIIPCAYFLYSINCGVKLLKALIPSITKCGVIYIVTLQFFIALGPGMDGSFKAGTLNLHL